MKRLKVPLTAAAVAVCLIAVVALVAYLIARQHRVVLGPPPKMVEVPAGSPAQGRNKDILKPWRQLVFEKGKAPGWVFFADKHGLAYIACLGENASWYEEGEGDQPPPAELCVAETKTGRVAERVPFAKLKWIGLSPDERYLFLGSPAVKDGVATGIIAVYAAGDLSHPLFTDGPTEALLGEIGCDGTLYLGYWAERKLRRVTANGDQSRSFDRVPRAMCLDPHCSSLYVSLWGRAKDKPEGEKYPPTSLVVIDPNTLNVLQTLTLPDREFTGQLAAWVGGPSLVAVSEGDTLDIIPIGVGGLLTVPGEPSGIRLKGVASGPPAVDEKRSLAYSLGITAKGEAFISVVDLAARRLVGSLLVSDPDEYWDQPWLSLSTTTDELWVVTDSIDRIPIYRVEDVIERARESEATNRPAGAPAVGGRRSPGAAAGNATP